MGYHDIIIGRASNRTSCHAKRQGIDYTQRVKFVVHALTAFPNFTVADPRGMAGESLILFLSAEEAQDC